MNVLVTGANGFIGSALVSRLLHNTDYFVHCLVRPGSSIINLEKSVLDFSDRCKIVYGVFSNYNECKDAINGIDVIFHLASAKSGAPSEMFQGSSVATKCLLEAIRNSDHKIKLVHCSSFSVYEVSGLKKNAVVDENTPLETHPTKRDIYAFSKWHQENLVRDYYNKYGIPIAILRPGVVYGHGTTPLPPRVGLNLFGLFLFLGGNNILPLTYVDNCADAFISVAKNSKFNGDVYNVVDDDLITAKEYLSIYRKKVKRLRYIRIPYSIIWLISIACEKYHKRSNGQLPDIFTRYKTSSIWKNQNYRNDTLKKIGWMPNINTTEGLAEHMAAIKTL